ncbi:hypothetical protein LOKO_02919 [Halomonas chromatireducens]|uniref:Uncharacterized protein n=1 Tax=Halomonas chromatireducens TaxID=507626 RepID=A0A120JWI0_9GAMM|nr:hypothetical protein LOKO_02919 [Halomonas chromatireducens]
MAHRAASLANLDLITLAERLGRRCREHGLSVTAAESCTGGGDEDQRRASQRLEGQRTGHATGARSDRHVEVSEGATTTLGAYEPRWK